MRRLIFYLLDHGVVPIISTKADNREFTDQLNRINERLAKEYDVPFWDFRGAVKDLPNHGLLKTISTFRTAHTFFTSMILPRFNWVGRSAT